MRIAGYYAAATLFCAFFGAVYELFSHEVYSYFMIYAFAIPLVGGVLPFLAIASGCVKRFPGWIFGCFYHAAVATLTVGSIMRGVLDIYGTTNVLVWGYCFAGALLLAGAVLFGVPAARQ